MGSRSRHAAKRIVLSLSTAVLATTSLARADVADAIWLGGAGNWFDATKWSGGVVPNNTASSTFRVVVPTGSVTTSAGTINIDALTIGGAGTLVVSGFQNRFSVLSSTVRVDGDLTSAGDF